MSSRTSWRRCSQRCALVALAALAYGIAAAQAGGAASKPEPKPEPKAADGAAQAARPLEDAHATTPGSITVKGQHLAYQAEAGILVVHLTDPMDEEPAPAEGGEHATAPPPSPEAGMSYVAYFGGEREDTRRPNTFLFNGGPGSATVWLHMGAFGPRRVLTADDTHSAAAPYRLVDNEYTLLDASDLVFVDAPGTGFGHLRGKDREKAFYGVDQDAHAFANFIVEFLSRHHRWNSPKYLFGESYGTTRAAALASLLQSEKNLDLNGIILLSQVLNFDDGVDAPQFNPGIDLPYELALPSYAATAWYHHRLAQRPDALEPLLREVEQFALGDYAQALAAGASLSPERRHAIAAKLAQYTGLPPD